MANQGRLIIVLLGFGLVAEAQEEPAIPSAEEWYKTEYAPLYQDNPSDNTAELAQLFADTLHLHEDGGNSVNGGEWITAGLEEWKIEGWIRSELAELEYDLLNTTTASFKAKWRDYYSGGNVAFECGWYLADFRNGKWRITEYATISCSDHGL